MKTRPTHPKPQTSKQAQREYRRHGPRITSQEARRLERSAVLDKRAEDIRKKEQRRKEAKRKRLEKEEADREVRRRMGVPEPKPKIAASQNLIEAFVVKAAPEASAHDKTDKPDGTADMPYERAQTTAQEDVGTGDDILDNEHLVERESNPHVATPKLNEPGEHDSTTVRAASLDMDPLNKLDDDLDNELDDAALIGLLQSPDTPSRATGSQIALQPALLIPSDDLLITTQDLAEIEQGICQSMSHTAMPLAASSSFGDFGLSTQDWRDVALNMVDRS